MAAAWAHLTEHVPDRALVGSPAILAYLHDVLQLRRPNGLPLKWRMVLRWYRVATFPLLHGGWSPRRRCLQPPMTTQHALTSWTLSQFSTAVDRELFSVGSPTGAHEGKSRPETSRSDQRPARAA